ncbi:MAG TPA: lysophospholipid acyltransferase family protein [Kofleriaceae bacterium]|jgi:1-acyl-sn-glycerol-3-phosphate acyltransferase
MNDNDDDTDESEEWYGEADPRVPDASVDHVFGDRIDHITGGFLGQDVFPRDDVRPDIGDSYLSREDREAAELRELERRMEQQRTPVFPIDLRNRIPLDGLWRAWRQLAMLGRSDVVDDFGRDPRATARWEWLFEFLYSKWFRVECTGLDNVPSEGRALLVANHAGSLPYDSAMVMHAVRRDHPARRDVRPLVEDTVFHLPFLGPIMNRIGGVRADPENAERLLRRDELVAVFPEGEKGMGKLWKERYRLQRFGRGGFVKLALRTGAPIIPVAVVGAEEAAPMLGKVTWFAKNIGIPWIPVTPTFPWLGPGGLLPLPSKWRIAFGEPIDLGGLGPDAAEDRLLVNKLADQIRTQIQSMIEDLLGRRRAPILGAFF